MQTDGKSGAEAKEKRKSNVRKERKMENIKNLIDDFSMLDSVQAIALGGSRAAGTNDEKSDYDVYVYVTQPIDREIRTRILSRYCSYMEIANKYWEEEDDCILNCGIVIELIYRNLNDFEGSLNYTVLGANAQAGYTTCMWDNLMQCAVLFDRDGLLSTLKQKYDIEYPEELRQNIIRKNFELLDGKIPSYSLQIEKAANRGDYVSVNHRTTEFLASYFDIIFAYNRQLHPGEKRLVEQCKKRCKSLPIMFGENLEKLLTSQRDTVILMHTVSSMVDNLRLMLAGDGQTEEQSVKLC